MRSEAVTPSVPWGGGRSSAARMDAAGTMRLARVNEHNQAREDCGLRAYPTGLAEGWSLHQSGLAGEDIHETKHKGPTDFCTTRALHARIQQVVMIASDLGLYLLHILCYS
jgi:hypothetical protein